MEIAHYGCDITTDVILRTGRGGVYLALGRLDGGVNFTFPWQRFFKADDMGWHAVFGPFDLMWRKEAQ